MLGFYSRATRLQASFPGGFGLSCGFDNCFNLFAMAGNDAVQFLLDLPQDARRIDAGKVPVHVFIHDFDQRKKLRQREICLHLGSKCTMLVSRGAHEN